MASKRKPTLKQLFKAWLKYKQKCSETTSLKWSLDDLAANVQPGSELIVHGENVYRVTATQLYGGRVNYDIDRIATSDEIETIK